MSRIQEEQRRWEERTLQPALARHPERREAFGLERLYVPEEAQAPYEEALGFPGEYPYTRGIQPTMYRGRLWTMRQYAGYATAEESNLRYRYLLSQGQTGLSVAFDLPTQIGYDSDHPLAEGEVGKVGVAIDSLADMERLFAGLPLDRVSASLTINAPAAVLLAMYLTVATGQGASPRRLRGTIQNDILKEYVARGTYIFPPGPSMRLITDTFRFGKEELPEWNVISVSGYHIREAGADAVQEVAFTLANAIAYVEAALAAGLDVDDLGRRLSFFFAAHSDLLEEVAKFRAARRLWARIMRHRFGARDPRSCMLRFHTQTAGSTLTAQQPENNVVRVTLQALAAILGGTQSLHTNSRDEALSLPTAESVAIALRTQQVIAHESGVADTIDPLGGSYCVETLTDGIERRATHYLERIERLGGALRAIETGFISHEIESSAYRYQREIERQERIVVGVNEFTDGDTGVAPARLRVDPEVQRAQVARLHALKATRDNARVTAALSALERSARGTASLMPPILEAVQAYATLGEICGLLRGVFGEYRPGGQ